jgi:hypothetical protein
MPDLNSASQRSPVSAAIPWWRRKPSRGEVIAAIALFVIVTAMILVALLIANTMGDRPVEDFKRLKGAAPEASIMQVLIQHGLRNSITHPPKSLLLAKCRATKTRCGADRNSCCFYVAQAFTPGTQ